MKITIKDIAKKTNYSTKTVSRVINEDPMVSEKTRLEIKDTIKAFGYRPNIIARSLRQQKTNMIGFVIPDILNPAFPMLFKGATDIFDKNGYYAFLSCSDDDHKKEEEFIRDFGSMLISGIVLVPTTSEGRDFSIFDEIFSPIVILDREIEGIKKDMVLMSNKTGAYDATRFLINKGHKKIAILSGPINTKTAENRVKGWEMAMKENRLFSKELIFYGGFSIDSGYEMTRKALGSLKKIDAFFCSNDLSAIGSMKALAEAGLEVPRDISIFGFDDIYISQFLKPPLTTVRHPLYEEGKAAAEILLSRINGNKEADPIRKVLPTSLVIRDSVAEKKI